MWKKDKGAHYLKKICYGNAAVTCISIPVAFLSAQTLSIVVTRASSGDIAGVVRYSAGLMALAFASAIFQAGAGMILQKGTCRAVHRAKTCFLEKLLENPPDVLFGTDYGELIRNVTDDMDQVIRRYTQLYPAVIAGMAGTAGYFLFLSVQSPVVAVSMSVISLIQLIPPFLVKKYMQISYSQCEEIEAAITDHIAEAVEGFEGIRLYGLKSWWQQKLSDYHKKYIHLGQKADAAAAAQRSMYRLADNILRFGTYALLGFYVISGWCSMHVAVSAIYLSAGFYGAVWKLFSTVPEMAVSGTAQKRILKWIPQEKRNQEKHNQEITASVPFQGAGIQLADVSCRLGGRDILHVSRFQFCADKNYLIKGSNGAGKSTLLHLIAGLILPDSGQICVEGMTGTKEPRQDVLFYIPQLDPEFRYDISALFGMFDKETRKRMYGNAKRFGLTEKIVEGKLVCDLSGGERKKVFLSIGFAMQPVWLLLDEPSNHLDREGKQTLCELIQERTGTITVSHDLRLKDVADSVIEIRNGRIWDEKKEY